MPRPAGPVNLRPLTGVERSGEAAFRSNTAEPWLCLDFDAASVAGRWLRLAYRTGFTDDPVRPLLRIDRRSGAVDHAVMPGPVAGGGIWVGRIPEDAASLAISPAAAPGPFAFSLDRMDVMSRLGLFAGAFARRPGLAVSTAWERLRGRKVRARHLIASIWGATPMAAYRGWLAGRETTRLRADGPGRHPVFGFVVSGGDPDAAERTIRSLEAQSHRGWRRLDLSSGPEGCDWVVTIQAGDVLDPDALACCAAAIGRRPGATLLYSDEDRLDAAGRRADPVLRPGWSPRLQEATAYLGGLLLRRIDASAGLLGAEAPPEGEIHHVRRILLHRGERGDARERLLSPSQGGVKGGARPGRDAAVRPARPPSGRASTPRPALRSGHLPREGEGSGTPLGPTASKPQPWSGRLVSVVVPNRDRLALISTCIEGLRTRTDYPHLEIVIVDNGSTEPATLGYYRSISEDGRVRVIDSPGEFNFSKLTNEGVAASRGAFVLLLNNDIEVIGPDWLDHLVAEAAPDVGAVGAKLLYPDGAVQHAGVVIGMGSHAGHVYRGRPDGRGWMGCLQVPHEVSAVTGACLLVERAKYDAVGGLDEERFPVSFNDIDFCLKLRARGWRNILAPAALLFHHESASRGLDVGAKQARAAREARHFTESWLGAMRDDPYFHPGLSLMRFDVDLG